METGVTEERTGYGGIETDSESRPTIVEVMETGVAEKHTGYGGVETDTDSESRLSLDRPSSMKFAP